MQELAGKLAALDPEAGAALRVIAYFDALVDRHVGLESLVRGAAVLSGQTARLSVDDRGLVVRVGADGRVLPPDGAVSPAWPHRPVGDGAGTVWVETTHEHRALDDLVLERLAAAVRLVLDRTRGRVVPGDGATLERLLLPGTTPEERERLVRRLGLEPATPVRLAAVLDGRTRDGERPVVLRAPDALDAPRRTATELDGVVAVLVPVEPPTPAGLAVRAADRVEDRLGRRVGLGPRVPAVDAARSWTAARVAVRFAAGGGADDPGRGVVDHADLGGLVLLADVVGPGTAPHPDVVAVDAAAAAHPWALATLDALTRHVSLRSAALEAHLHHSTLQSRLPVLENALGWPLGDPAGRSRLVVALALRRLHATA
ncbi:helix-turn-helix domain-containing protein [Lapillicoccus jejuensis]|uniref:PucR-like helix-turn-helix protein n=1 Tax=Lapillicoccus jejuensis TaxID=402171 RepID=A0A542E568_9MICO|nr:helix-turn-helix domain-containing protein [Lapillicoccus jejuensis]TQJ10426.1 PucR-like helix-turn-helix protein [Lapillicoccus jejuensis]